MQPTLIRFGPDLFAQLKEEAARSGVSVAEYVREAVVARLAQSAPERGYDAVRNRAREAREKASENGEATSAVRAQGQHAVRRALKNVQTDGDRPGARGSR